MGIKITLWQCGKYHMVEEIFTLAIHKLEIGRVVHNLEIFKHQYLLCINVKYVIS
jgi:hypothetical protein